MNPILIHKGDSTTFADVEKFLTFTIATGLDLTDWKAKFVLGWITKEIEDISSKSFEVILSSEDTKQLRLGKQYGSIILTDAEGQIKTIANNIPFEVTTAVVENEYQEVDLRIPQSSGVDIILRVSSSSGSGGAVNSVNGMTGDVIIDIPSLEGYVKNTDYATKATAGAIKVDEIYGIQVTNTGFLYPASFNSYLYQQRGVSVFISKGTLENNKNNIVKRAITENDIVLTADEKTKAKAWLGYADQTDIMQAIAAIPQFKLSIVDELPLAGEKMTLYLVPKEGTDNDVYNEYIWIEQTASFEHLGTTAVDLTDYVKNTDYAGKDGKAGVFLPSTIYGLRLDGAGYLRGFVFTLDAYKTANESGFICKGTLENVLTQYKKVSEPMTEEAYNALATKDSNTLYLIEE